MAFTKFNNYSVAECWGFLILDSVIFLLIGLYIDNVFPGMGGTKRPWYYFVTRAYWSPNSVAASANVPISESEDSKREEMLDMESRDPFFEEVSHDLRAQKNTGECFDIEKMTKKFDDGKVAVKNFTLEIYKGQVFILLGHNGAGKTTALSMLTGLLVPTSGRAFIKGIDVFRENSKLKETLGICPQQSIVYDMLDIDEHLSIFCSLKNINYMAEREKLVMIMRNLGFADCLKKQANQLSGGQKRKLSVLLSFIGDPGVIMLDEPTSGLDVDSRRKIWEVIKGIKQDRIILMTTHYMDEAEQLGDRIAIMSDGELKCCGSSLFLKRQFRTGYHLTMVKTPSFNQSQVNALLSKHVHDFQLNQDTVSEATYNVPFEAAGRFPPMFAEFDASLETLGINSYGVAITSLEDVFLKVGEERGKNGNIEEAENEFSISRGASRSFFKNMLVVILRVWLQAVRNPRILILEILLPFILFVLSFASSFIAASNEITLNLDAVTKKLPVVLNTSPSPTFARLKQNLPYEHLDLSIHSQDPDPISRAFEFYALENRTYGDTSHFGGYYVVDVGSELKVMVMGEPRWPLMSNYLCSVMTNAFLKMYNPQVTVTPKIVTMAVHNVVREELAYWGSVIFFITLTGIAFSIPIASIAYFLVKERKAEQKFMEMFHGLNVYEYWVGRFLADHTKLFVPFLVIIAIKFILKIDVLCTVTSSSLTTSW